MMSIANKLKLLLMLLITVMLFNCCFFVSFNIGNRPDNYPGTRWTCENYDIYFDAVDAKIHYIKEHEEETVETFDKVKTELIGEMVIDGQTVEIEIWIQYVGELSVCLRHYDPSPLVREREEDVLFYGTCSFYSDKMVVSVLDDDTKKIADLPDKLVFIRSDLDSVVAFVYDIPVIIKPDGVET